MIGTEPVELRVLVERLESIAARRLASGPRSEAAVARARQLADLLRRAHSGPGGVVGRPARRPAPRADGRRQEHDLQHDRGPSASPTGVLRPTTRVAVVLVHPDDRQRLIDGRVRRDPAGPPAVRGGRRLERGLAVVDAPDIDSLEHANRALADRLVEAADLCCFVTTATRYADRVPWAVLSRVEERGLPLLVVVNRMPPDPADRADILADIRRLVADAG